MTAFVLVHGSWHDGSGWDAVATHLRKAGHSVTAPTLPGHGRGASPDVGFADYVAAVADAVRAAKEERVVLVGHSLGGAVVAAAAGLVRERLERLVFLAAIIPAHGERLLDVLPPSSAEAFAAMAAASPDNAITLPWPVWREAFIGDAESAVAQRAFDGLCPEPFRPVTEVIDSNGFETLETPRSFINCRGDTAFPPGEWGFFPRFYNRLGLCRLIDIEGSHEVMFSAPERTAQAILQAARD